MIQLILKKEEKLDWKEPVKQIEVVQSIGSCAWCGQGAKTVVESSQRLKNETGKALVACICTDCIEQLSKLT